MFLMIVNRFLQASVESCQSYTVGGILYSRHTIQVGLVSQCIVFFILYIRNAIYNTYQSRAYISLMGNHSENTNDTPYLILHKK